MSAKTSTAAQLRELIDKSSAEDLTEIDGEIAKAEAHLESLVTLRKVIDRKVNGKPEHWSKRAPKPKPVVSGGGNGASDSPAERGAMLKDRRLNIAKIIAKEGPLPASAFVNRLQIPSGSITAVLQCDWFQQTANGYRLTEVGRRETGL